MPLHSPFLLSSEATPFLTCPFPKLPSKNSRYTLRASSPQQHSFLQSLTESNENTLPCVRTFENDLARLSLVGSVHFQQALAAAAADGGRAADEHVSSGFSDMVVETVFPGPHDEHSTVSTRLFLPANKVREKARKFRNAFNGELFKGTTSENILAMTFRQVVMQQLWNFELSVFTPGSVRHMKDLENPREVPMSFFLGSSDERVISVLAETVCAVALQDTERRFLDEFLMRNRGFFKWFRKPKKFVSKDSSVVIYKLFEDEIVENAVSLLENFNSMKSSFKERKMKKMHRWWPLLAQSQLDKIGGAEFSAWTSEFVPAYKIEIDADKAKDLKFEGCRKSQENKFEVLLTHSQMVGLAEILDIYYEDVYSLPNKELSCSVVADFNNFPNRKRNTSLIKMLAMTLASGIFLISLSALGQFYFPGVGKRLTYAPEHKSVTASEFDYVINESLDPSKLQEFCFSIVKKIKDAFGWPGEILMGNNSVAWIGEIPHYVYSTEQADSSGEKLSAISSSTEKIDSDTKSLAQDIASYQVVLSTDGKIVGFQPTSRIAVNHWAANPLAKELYGKRKLSPGLIELGLNIPRPSEVVVIELLMSVSSNNHFTLARPVL